MPNSIVRETTRKSSFEGFTLIELLIVIAIILILVAIALPNFIEAQLRAKVVKANAEMRGLALGLESYRTDWPRYPPQALYEPTPFSARPDSANRFSLIPLTTPIPYLAELPLDIFAPSPGEPISSAFGGPYPFSEQEDIEDGHVYFYWSQQSLTIEEKRCAEILRLQAINYGLLSLGPDRDADADNRLLDCILVSGFRTGDIPWVYTPTNGTRSNGDIQRFRP